MKAVIFFIGAILWLIPQYSASQTEQNQKPSETLQGGSLYLDSLQQILKQFGISQGWNDTENPACGNGKVRIKPGTVVKTIPPGEKEIYQSGTDNVTEASLPNYEINLIWIHGLNGNQGSLYKPAHATQHGIVGFPARRAVSHGVYGDPNTQFYNEDNGLTAATANLQHYASQYLQNTKTERDYIIAHSQGGMVAREWLRKMEQSPASFGKFAHGLVTFGSPHDGAMILNNCRPNLGNKAQSFLNEACKQLGGTVVADVAKKNFFTRLLLSGDMKTNILKNGCDVLSSGVIPLALDNYYKRTTLDYYVGSPFLVGGSGIAEGLSDYTLKVPVVQFVGIEEQPVLWKLTSSLASMGHDKLDNLENYFGYSPDHHIEKKVSNMIDEFSAKATQEDAMAEYYQIVELSCYARAAVAAFYGNFINSAALIAQGVLNAHLKNGAIENKRLYEGGRNWLAAANDIYLTAIVGALETKTTKHCRVIDYLKCTSPQYNTPGAGKPPVDVIVTRSFMANNGSCFVTPIAQEYSSYHFQAPDGNNYVGPCTGRRETIETIHTQYSYKPNDGVVLAESAGKVIKVSPGLSHRIVPLPGSNHEQMKNDSRMKEELMNLYNGKHGELFAIKRR